MPSAIESELERYKADAANLAAEIATREAEIAEDSHPLLKEALADRKRQFETLKALIEKQEPAVKAMLAKAQPQNPS